MNLLPLSYRRPAYVQGDALPSPSPTDVALQDSSASSFNDVNDKSEGSLRSGQSSTSAGIPAALSFDRIMDGGTCPVSQIHSLFLPFPFLFHGGA